MIIAVVIVIYARRIRGTDAEYRVLTTCGWIILWASLTWTAWGLTPRQFNIDQSLPLHFSDALCFATGITPDHARWLGDQYLLLLGG